MSPRFPSPHITQLTSCRTIPGEPFEFKITDINVRVRVEVISFIKDLPISDTILAVEDFVDALDESPNDPLDRLELWKHNSVRITIVPVKDACAVLSHGEASTVVEGVSAYMRREILYRPVAFVVRRRGVGQLMKGMFLLVEDGGEGDIQVLR